MFIIEFGFGCHVLCSFVIHVYSPYFDLYLDMINSNSNIFFNVDPGLPDNISLYS